MIVQNLGAFCGMIAFTKAAQRFGRKPAFAVAYVAAFFATVGYFQLFNSKADIWMSFIMGFCQLGLFAGFAIYLPELFPTRLRSTGTSFCYNVGRYIAAVGPLTLGLLASEVFGSHGKVMSLRYAGVTMCASFLIGLVALPFAPETKG